MVWMALVYFAISDRGFRIDDVWLFVALRLVHPIVSSRQP
jgi:hypothetical protein